MPEVLDDARPMMRVRELDDRLRDAPVAKDAHPLDHVRHVVDVGVRPGDRREQQRPAVGVLVHEDVMEATRVVGLADPRALLPQFALLPPLLGGVHHVLGDDLAGFLDGLSLNLQMLVCKRFY